MREGRHAGEGERAEEVAGEGQDTEEALTR